MSGSIGSLFGVSESSISKPLEPFFHFGSSSSFLGSSSMVSFEDVCGGEKRSGRPFFYAYDQEENGDGDFDDYLHQPEKKRRLTIEQVRFLEKSFETENKLEPERKVQLAMEIGLQPRQVAIWFQNRRARWKTKQMEKDFDTLQDSYNILKLDYESLVKEKEKLKVEVDHLTNKLQLKEQDQRINSELSNLFTQPITTQQDLNTESTSESKDQQIYSKQEDLSSAKSDVIDSDSPHCMNVRHSFAEPGSDSSYAFEADHSDISQDDEDDLNKTLMPSSHAFLKIEGDELVDNSCHFNISGVEHASMFWPYWDINI